MNKDNYILEGWYEDKDFKIKYDFTRPVIVSKNLYAKWIPKNPVEESDPENITVTFHSEIPFPIDETTRLEQEIPFGTIATDPFGN